jgi:uncharacterized protein
MDERPKNKNEEEYFTRQEAELMKELRARLDAEEESQKRAQHFMKCPKCGADLREVEQQSVKVDICPECQGMWLDAGEMELLRQAAQTSGGGRFMNDLFSLFNRPPK